MKIIKNTDEARDKYGWSYGGEHLRVLKEDVQALLDGKCWAIDVNGGEYIEFISLKEQK